MKELLAALLCMVSMGVFAQSVGDTSIYKKVEVVAAFPGGPERMQDYIQFRLKGDQSAFLDVREGKIIVEFVVEKNGRIGTIKVVQGLDPVFDQNYVDLIRGMPKWTPALVKGIKVRSLFTYTMELNYYMR